MLLGYCLWCKPLVFPCGTLSLKNVVAIRRQKEGEAVRIWKEASGSLITDEQLLRRIAAFGSLSEAAANVDVTLVTDAQGADNGHGCVKGKRLCDYLGDADE